MATVYIGNLDVNATVRDLHYDFDRYGRVTDIWVARNPPGFAFVEYEDDRDARDAVRDMDGRMIRDKRIRVEVSRRGRMGRTGDQARNGPKPRSSEFRVRITNLPRGTDWKELKDVVKSIVDPAFVDVNERGDGVADFHSARDRDLALARLDGYSFKGDSLTAVAEDGAPPARDAAPPARDGDRDRDGGRDRDSGRDRDGGRDRERGRERERSRSRSRGFRRSESGDRR